MITYILQTIAFQLVFLALYEVLLKKETFFQWNRVYLLGTPLIALLLPFIKIEALQTAVPQNLILSLPEIALGTATNGTNNNPLVTSAATSTIEIIFLSGMVISTLIFVFKLSNIRQLKQKGKQETLENNTVIHVPNSTDAFSFAGTIFLGESLNQKNKKYILAHEQVHVKQKHYVDLLYFELLRIVFWFNPLVYLYQKRIATIHEYIADAEVLSQTEKTSYYQNLLSEVFQTHTVSFINTFFNPSLIKKRIVMLHKTKSRKIQLFKFALLLPLLTLFVAVSSCEQSQTDNSQNDGLQTIVEIEQVEDGKDYSLDVPFAIIDQAPIYPGCENLSTNEELKKCFSDKITKLISENFDTSVAKDSGLNGKQRISVQFTINQEGELGNVVARAPYEPFVQEAIRVMNLIPLLTPGKHEDKSVSVLYSVPIIFEIPK